LIPPCLRGHLIRKCFESQHLLLFPFEDLLDPIYYCRHPVYYIWKEYVACASCRTSFYDGCLPGNNIECDAPKRSGADCFSVSLFLHPSIFLSPRLPIFCVLSLGLDTLSLCSPSPPPPPLCPGLVWVINYSWACSEGPGLLIPAHRGLALIRPVVQLNWKASYTSYRHTHTHTQKHTHTEMPSTVKPH